MELFCQLSAESLRLGEVLLVRTAGRNLGGEGMFPDAGRSGGDHKALCGHQVLHLRQTVIVVAVAVDCNDRTAGPVSCDVLLKILPHQQRHHTAVHRRADQDKILRPKVIVPTAVLRKGKVDLLHLPAHPAGDGAKAALGCFGTAEIQQCNRSFHIGSPLLIWGRPPRLP